MQRLVKIVMQLSRSAEGDGCFGGFDAGGVGTEGDGAGLAVAAHYRGGGAAEEIHLRLLEGEDAGGIAVGCSLEHAFALDGESHAA